MTDYPDKKNTRRRKIQAEYFCPLTVDLDTARDSVINEDKVVTCVPELIELLVVSAIEIFMASDYPNRPVEMVIPGGWTMLIRCPPSLPDDAIVQLGSYFDAFRAFPAIEAIDIDPRLQGRGLFTRFVEALAKTPGVRAVVVSNVTNAEFAKRLTSRCEAPDSRWRLYKGGWSPCFAYWADTVNS